MSQHQDSSWLLLLLQLPPQPSSLRVRVWRRLQQIGAVAVKNAAYVLPETEATLEDFTWLRQEIEDSGGGALLLRARGLHEADQEIRDLFRHERDAAYLRLAAEARALASELSRENDLPAEALGSGARSLRQFRERLEQLREIDFFSAPASGEAAAALREAEEAVGARMQQGGPQSEAPEALSEGGRLWVTRAGVYVDRLACCWIIARFLDPAARFQFLHAAEPLPAGAIPFDLAGVEFGHHGPRCSAETLAARFRPEDRALRAVCEVVHDLDLKDEAFGRPEAAGLKRLLDGICAAHPEDEARLRMAAPLFDALYAGFLESKGEVP